MDDAARAAVLYCRLWRRRAYPSDRSAALGLLRFLTFMQDEDGRFVNFLLDWTGRQNQTGSTSYPGGPQWQARALHALALGVATFGRQPWDDHYWLGMQWLEADIPYLDVRAVCALAALEHWRSTGAPASAERALTWADEIAQQREGGRLLDAAGVAAIHLWGHLQEAALAEVGAALGRPALVERARESADALLLPAVEWCAQADRVLPFDVSCVVSGLAAVGRATGDGRYADGALQARSWFHGRNAAGQSVHDREGGLVYDGIDDGRVSRNSGAESNIEGALALLD